MRACPAPTLSQLCLEDVRNYFDFLESDVANLMVGLRLLQGVWFLVEMKKTLRV